MASPFLGEIQIFGFNYPPAGWALCNGATLSVNQNSALFALIGTTYGGNGSTTFQLPNLVGRAAFSQGTGPGLSQYDIGEFVGAAGVTLTAQEMPAHRHVMTVNRQPTATLQSNIPVTDALLLAPGKTTAMTLSITPDTRLAPNVVGITGGNQAHENRQPLLALNYCIALQGEFPRFD
ncbi:tail fiber protein [Janthinobacterium sp. SUN100]|uniref:phage tail protein n=1 Tax=Janthinobacterium sp. SUN100 TaxID=3004101 RepID=UPI0025B0EFA0|nr:tail fiber protein [Janthinobacterium sp. SUN100]MDN2702143.1 tail fiber protein [Janthinobacterium sp. SUN100]